MNRRQVGRAVPRRRPGAPGTARPAPQVARVSKGQTVAVRSSIASPPWTPLPSPPSMILGMRASAASNSEPPVQVEPEPVAILGVVIASTR